MRRDLVAALIGARERDRIRVIGSLVTAAVMVAMLWIALAAGEPISLRQIAPHAGVLLVVVVPVLVGARWRRR